MDDSANETSTTYDYPEYDDDVCNKTEVTLFDAAVTPVFFTVVIMFSCVGNVLVLWILIKYENLKSMTNTFLLNLAISDLVFTIGLPVWVSFYTSSQGWLLGEPVCKAASFIFFVGFYSSTIFLTVMTVHRYMAVVHPLSVVLNRRSFHATVTSAVIWLLSVLAATPHVIFSTLVDHENKFLCDYSNINWKLVSTYQQNFFFLTAFVTISFCYVHILQRLLRPTSHTRRKTIRLILCIVVVFFLGWAPYNVASFLDSLISWEVAPFNECSFSTIVDYVFYISRLVAFSHCCLNPVFYVFMGIKFRNHLKKLLWNVCKDRNQPTNRNSHLIYSNGEEISMY
ncbi:chemokine XC receptor 1-like [Brachyhypopomus gauderio]|uniref:chemokine XC receptor 1-like n=1 Tax=Brachyhypopomus gauderio TaxID=698409 RepID=UPI0040420632